MAELAIILLSELVLHFALGIGSNLFELTTQNEAFAQGRVVD